MMKKINHKKGFTLIELVAVIAIIAIILLIAVPKVISTVDSSKKQSFKANAQMILKAVELQRYKILDFDPTEITKENIKTKLGIDDVNIESLVLSLNEGKLEINIIGKGVWSGYTASGTMSKIIVVKNGIIEPTAKIYGVIFNPEEGVVGTRTDDSIGLSYIVNTSTIDSDFDTAEIYSEIEEETDSFGNKFIKIPKFWIKKTKVGKVWTYQISKIKQDDNYYLPYCFNQNGQILSHVLVGKYNASLSLENKLESKTLKAPLVSKNITQFRNYAKANGVGYGIIDIHIIDILQTLFYIEFATIDSQTIFRGYVDGNSSTINTGTADEILKSGSPVSNSNGKNVNKYRGIENLWGNINQFIDGININDYQVYISNNFEGYVSETYTGDYNMISYINASENGGVQELGFDPNNPSVQLPVAVGVNNYKDFHYRNGGKKVALFGGVRYHGNNAGITQWDTNYSWTNTNPNFGSRLVKVGL